MMQLDTITLYGIALDVYYTYSVTKDAYGTGDSPTSVEITLEEISLDNNTTDLQDILSDDVKAEIERKLVKLILDRKA